MPGAVGIAVTRSPRCRALPGEPALLTGLHLKCLHVGRHSKCCRARTLQSAVSLFVFWSCQCVSVKLSPPVFQTPAAEECPAESCREGPVRADHREGSVWDIPGQTLGSSLLTGSLGCLLLRPLPWFHWVALSSAAWHAQCLSSCEAVGLLFSSWSPFQEQSPVPLLSVLHSLLSFDSPAQ